MKTNPRVAGDSWPSWCEPLCRIPADHRNGTRSVRELFERASPDISDEPLFIDLVADWLATHPTLIEDWQTYSYDKRVSSGPYMDKFKVGIYDHGYHAVRRHRRVERACADFILREARSVLAWRAEPRSD